MYMHNLESVLENKSLKILWDFEIQIGHLTSARQPGLEIVNKKEDLPNSETERNRRER